MYMIYLSSIEKLKLKPKQLSSKRKQGNIMAKNEIFKALSIVAKNRAYIYLIYEYKKFIMTQITE